MSASLNDFIPSPQKVYCARRVANPNRHHLSTMKDTIHLSSSKQSILATGLDSLDDIQDIINWAGPLVNDEEVIIFASEPLEETVEGLSDNVFFVPTQDVTPLLVVMKDQKEQKQINFVPPHKKALSLAQHLEKSENTMIKDGFCYQHELDSD